MILFAIGNLMRSGTILPWKFYDNHVAKKEELNQTLFFF
jgi:hypothetical protein